MKTLTQLELSGKDVDTACEIAKRLGYSQTSYTEHSELNCLTCHPNNNSQKSKFIIKTAELGFLVIQGLEDLGFKDWKELNA